jgi:hypothetical protein
VNDRSSALFGAKYNLVLLMFINFFFSVLAPTQGVMSEAQRRAFGGDSISFCLRRTILHNLRGQSVMPKT